jgi:sec-independent protein translocase protein TatC
MSLPSRKVFPSLEEITAPRDLPFWQHLEELRRRVIFCLVAFLLAFAGCYFFAEKIFAFFMAPVLQTLGKDENAQLYFTNLLEPFLTYFNTALYAALFLSTPVFFFHLWRFVAPGLYRNERRGVLTLAILSTLFFVAGSAFAYYFVFPVGFRFFLSFATGTLKPLLTMREYLAISARLLLGFGLIFELPLVVLGLTYLGVVSARQVVGFWRYAVILIAVASALLTPPDLLSMMLMMVPMLFLYGLSIALAFLVSGNRRPPTPDNHN